MGIFPNYGITWSENLVRGRMLTIPRSKSNYTAIAKNMRDQSLIVHGGNIFNLLPVDIRNWSGSNDSFKEKLDMFCLSKTTTLIVVLKLDGLGMVFYQDLMNYV